MTSHKKSRRSLAERLDPKLLVQILNDFFDHAARTIARYDGFIDKFIGDEIMNEFGAPAYFENHRERAVNCAMELCRSVKKISEKIKEMGIDWPLNIGIGINSDPGVFPVKSFSGMWARGTARKNL